MVRCDVCDTELGSNSTFLRHMKSKHEGVMFQCEHCDFKSNRKDSLTRHMVKHSESRKRKLEPEPEKSKRKKYADDEMDDVIPNLPDQVEDLLEEINLNELFNVTDSDLQRILELDPEHSRTEKEIEPEKEKFPEQVEDNLELDPEDSRTEKELEPEKEKLTGKGIEKKKDESNVFKCNDCDSTFLYKYNLYKHIRAKH